MTWNSSGKVQKSSPSQCEKCVVDDTPSVHTAETRKRLGRSMNVYIRAPVPGNGILAEQLGILEQTWKISPIYRPGRFFFSSFQLKRHQPERAANQRFVFPNSAHFPEGAHPGCPGSRDKGRNFHNAPKENKIKPEESLFLEGPSDYN